MTVTELQTIFEWKLGTCILFLIIKSEEFGLVFLVFFFVLLYIEVFVYICTFVILTKSFLFIYDSG